MRRSAMGRWRKRSMEDLAGSSNWFIGGDVVGISWVGRKGVCWIRVLG